MDSTVDRPALVAISHGTSSVDGHNAIADLMDAVRARYPELDLRSGYVDVERPGVAETIASVAEHVGIVVVPILLSAGYHVHVDLARAVRTAGARVTLAPALGPDPRLVRIARDRLMEAGWQPGDRVIMAAAGSSDARAVEDCATMAAQLATLIDDDVTVAFHSAHPPFLPDAISDARARYPDRRVVVSSYLLAPGHFQSLAERCAADVVTEPILSTRFGPADSLIELVSERYRGEAEVHGHARALSAPSHTSP
jgi:sirohydrochlorin ferrochelatase